MACFVRVLPGPPCVVRACLASESWNSLELKGTNATHEAFHDQSHLPRPQVISRGSFGPTLRISIVLRKASARVGR